MIFSCLVLFTLTNLTYLSSFIESYNTQLAFIETAKNAGVKENSLFFVDTNILETNGIVTLNRAWALTYMVAGSLGIAHVAYVGPAAAYDLSSYVTYESKYIKDYVFENPDLYLIEFEL